MEVLTSNDGKEFTSAGRFNMNLRQRDVPINHMVTDDDTATGWNFELIPPQPVKGRYVKYKVETQRYLSITEVQVFDEIKYTPFDLKIALPGN